MALRLLHANINGALIGPELPKHRNEARPFPQRRFPVLTVSTSIESAQRPEPHLSMLVEKATAALSGSQQWQRAKPCQIAIKDEMEKRGL